MAGSNAHTSLQIVRASGDGAATAMWIMFVGCHGGHRKTRCAMSKGLMEKDSNGRTFDFGCPEKDSNGRTTPTAVSPTPPVLTTVSANATRDAARTLVAPPALASGAAGQGHPHACGGVRACRSTIHRVAPWGGRADSTNRSPPHKHSPMSTRQRMP